MRKSGVLMHITSLPGSWGVGCMGREAYRFIDFLKNAGQCCWQILPLTPTGYGDSPYQSSSTYAGNHYLIDLDSLVDQGLLERQELERVNWSENPNRVDYGSLYTHKLAILRNAHARFADEEGLTAFCRKNSSWLPDYCLFMALKDRFEGEPWYRWPHKLKFREPDAIWNARQELKVQIRFYSFVQYLFFKQWNAIRTYAKENGIQIIGDVPIYVPYDSVEVWSSPEWFQLDESAQPTMVAGCPPDAFSEDGQLWGNPLYRWDVMKRDGYSWWIRRLEAAARLYDVIRIDHFRGLESYWAIPYGDETARNGHWVKGPGMDFIKTIQNRLPGISLIAEDLGFLTPEVLQLRDEAGYPGMKILGFAFDSRDPSDYLPHSYSRNTVCYTGTHDNMTTRQWFENASADAVAYAQEYMHLTREEGFVWGMIRTAFSSVSDLCIIPMQDYLELGAEARMNFPGTQSGDNWSWRADPGYITPALTSRIYKLTKLYGRLADRYKQ